MDQDPNQRNYLHHHNLQHHHPEENDVPHNYFGHMQLTTSSYAEPSYLSMHHPQDQNTLTAQHQHQHLQHQHHHMGVVPMVSGAMQIQLPAAITPQPYHQNHGMGMSSPVGPLVFDDNGLGPIVNMGYPEQQNMLGAMQYMQPLEAHTMGQDNRYAMDLPVSGGMEEYAAHPISSANTLTEFTKRKNWPQRLLEEVPNFMHVLSPDGKIVYTAPSAKQVTGFAAEELIGKILADFLHDDDRGLFWRKFNACISNEGDQEFRMFYRFRGRDGNFAVFDVTGHPHFNNMEPRIATATQRNAGECSGFFMAARPYLQRNSELIDSFLEHRIENERLMQRVADLKREEEEEALSYASPTRTYSESTPRNDAHYTGSTILGSRSPHGMPGMSPNGISLTKHNLDSIANVDSIGDKMTRFEGSTRTEAIEMFTGLRFGDGERSKGISTGDTSPALIRGDAGVPIPLEPHHRQMGDKKKKMKMTEEYVCTDCGTLESPEWRKGPKGPKTLCNACGLRWAKEKKRNADHMAGMTK